MKMDNQVVTRGVKYNLKQEVKAQQGSLLSQTDWVVVRKADNDMQYQITLQHGEQLSELKLQRWKQQLTMQQIQMQLQHCL